MRWYSLVIRWDCSLKVALILLKHLILWWVLLITRCWHLRCARHEIILLKRVKLQNICNKQKRYARPGFTLMEILIAVMILGLLGAMLAPALNSIYKNQQKKAAKGTLSAFKKGISMYQMHVGALPTTLKDLIKKPKEERAA